MGNENEKAKILAVMRAYCDAMKKEDLEALLDLYSEDWQDYHGARKDSLKNRFEQAKDKGDYKTNARDLDIDISTAITALNGDKAIFTPVIHSSPSGSITYAHTLKKEADGVWRLVYTKGIDWETFPLDTGGRMEKAAIAQSALATRRFREQVLSDPHRPGYHIVHQKATGHRLIRMAQSIGRADTICSISFRIIGLAESSIIGAIFPAQTSFTGAIIPQNYWSVCTVETASSTRTEYPPSAITK